MAKGKMKINAFVIALTALLIASIFVLGAGCEQQSQAIANPPEQIIPQGPQTHTVNIERYNYNPETITIKVGDTVTWVNVDSLPHTITNSYGREFISGAIMPGYSFSYTFNNPGTYGYYCSLHSTTAKGTVIVE